MKLLRTCIIIGCILTASTSLATQPIFHEELVGECVGDQFQVSITISYIDPDLEIMVYRDMVVPSAGGSRLNITPEPIPAPPYGEDLVFVFTDPDVHPLETLGTAARYVIEATYPDGSISGSVATWLSCGDTMLMTRGYLIDDLTIQPCEGSGLLECTDVVLLYGHLTVWVGSNELLDFYGVPENYDPDSGNCNMTLYDIIPVGAGALCEEVVATEGVSWSGIKAIYR